MADRNLFTGAVWTGRQAVPLGLADSVGDLRGTLRERYGEKVELHVVPETRGSLLACLLRRSTPGQTAASLSEGALAASRSVPPGPGWDFYGHSLCGHDYLYQIGPLLTDRYGDPHVTPAAAPLHCRDRRAEGAHGRGRLEQPRPQKVALAYTPTACGGTGRSSSRGVTRLPPSSPASGRAELDYRLIKEVWAHEGNRIAVRFAYEWRDDSGQWFRSYGNENWEFDAAGLMARPHRLDQRSADCGIRP